MMKGMLIALVLVVAVVIGLSFLWGWWNVASDSTDSKLHFNVTVDKDRIQEDAENVLGKASDDGQHVKDRTTAPIEKE